MRVLTLVLFVLVMVSACPEQAKQVVPSVTLLGIDNRTSLTMNVFRQGNPDFFVQEQIGQLAPGELKWFEVYHGIQVIQVVQDGGTARFYTWTLDLPYGTQYLVAVDESMLWGN